MSGWRRGLDFGAITVVAGLLASVAAPARAQEAAGSGGGETPSPDAPAASAPSSSERKAAEVPPGHPPVGPAGARQRIKEQEQAEADVRRQRAVQGTGDHGGRRALQWAMGRGQKLTSAEPSDAVPAGTIRVRVEGVQGEALEGASVLLGILSQGGGGRKRIAEQTDANGEVVYSGLETGSGQAYRVSVPYEGAKYGSTPFRLPPGQGYQVRITALPTTSDPKSLLLAEGRTMLELKNERVHVIQQYRLMNLGETTYVFPDDGLLVELPDDFTAFQTQETMTDQRVARDDEGFRVHGSLPPGAPATLVWAFDIPVSGTEATFEYPVPWSVYTYQVMAAASEGMRLDVDGMPATEKVEHDGGTMLVTEVRRRPEDPPLDRVEITLRGIPGPGPYRWMALGGMLIMVFAGLMLATQGGRRAVDKRARQRRRRELLEEAAEIERMHAAGEIGPRYRQQRMEAVVTELADLLHQEATTAQRKAEPAKA